MARTREKMEQAASKPPFQTDQRKLKPAEVLNLSSSSLLKRRNQCLKQMVARSAAKRAY